MTLKELAHAAQQTLQTRAGCDVKRSHVHELLAAAFGRSSWAAFLSESVLADGGVGDAPEGASPRVIGRAVQLQYTQGAAVEMAGALLVFVAERQLSSVRWSELADVLTPAMRVADDDELDRDEEEDWDDDDDEAVPVDPPIGLTRDRLLRSPLLLHSLEHAAEAPNPRAHHLLAALYHCERPNPYLYEESLKGRVLTTVERGWVNEYLRLEPQFRKYEAHLKAAALGGVRSAAVEYAAAFDSQEFFDWPSACQATWMRNGWPRSRRRRNRVPRGCAMQRSRVRSRRWSNWPVRATSGSRSAGPNPGMPIRCGPRPSGRWRMAMP